MFDYCGIHRLNTPFVATMQEVQHCAAIKEFDASLDSKKELLCTQHVIACFGSLLIY